MTACTIILALAIAPQAAEEKADYSDLANLIRQAVVPLVPREHEDASEWGATIPFTPEVRLPRVRRTIVTVDGKPMMPQGAWKRTKIQIADPDKSVSLSVVALEPIDKERTRLVVDVSVQLHGQRQRQQWAKGLKLLDLTVEADAEVAARIETELSIKLDATKFPPEFSVTPKVVKTTLELKQFDLNRVGPVLLGGKEARDLGEDLKTTMEGMLKQYEMPATEKLNAALAKALKDGRGGLSAATLLKLNLPQKK